MHNYVEAHYARYRHWEALTIMLSFLPIILFAYSQKSAYYSSLVYTHYSSLN